MLQPILKRLFNHNTLSREEAKEILVNITTNTYSQTEVVAFLSVFMMRTVTVDELSGFRDALLELCHRVDLSEFETIDMCGTGGDGKNTFNISTLASLVVAGAGYKVAKHGNSGVSSSCGSSNVMEYLGYQFSSNNDQLKREIDQVGICFLHAPLFHPAMKAVGPIRRDLGIKTFFNMLGPMVNPSNPKYQLIGVFDLELARLYQYLYQQTDTRFSIVHSIDGYDEVSLTGPFKVITTTGEQLMNPQHLGLPVNKPQSIAGGDSVKTSATIFKQVINGQGTPSQNNAVIANAALAIKTIHPERSIEASLQEAKESLTQGKAAKTLSALLDLQR